MKTSITTLNMNEAADKLQEYAQEALKGWELPIKDGTYYDEI